MQITVRGELFPSDEQAREIDDLMRVQSSCMRYSYNRLCEGRSKSEIEEDLKEKFFKINSRYRRDGYFRAKFNYDSALKLVKAGELESPEKIVFGGRKNLKKRERDEITDREWRELRNNQLYSRGEKLKGGNLNLKLVEHEEKLFLRVNVGDREWIHIPAYIPNHLGELLSGEKPYGVRILRKNGEYKLRVGFGEDRRPKIKFGKGAVGVDFNHDTVDLALANDQGQLKDVKTIECHVVTITRRNKRKWLIENLAKRIVDYAKYWQHGLVIEKLNDVARRRQNQHGFTHKKFLEAIKRRAEREGVALKEVNPAYISVIGRHKYVPHYHITIHQAAALVVARRGQGFSEHLRGLKTPLLEAMEA